MNNLDDRVQEVMDVIEEVVGDKRVSRDELREFLGEIKDRIDLQLECLDADDKRDQARE